MGFVTRTSSLYSGAGYPDSKTVALEALGYDVIITLRMTPPGPEASHRITVTAGPEQPLPQGHLVMPGTVVT